MSASRQLGEQLDLLGEIREVLSSLKTLALLETKKLARLADVQRHMLASIETAAADLAAHFPVASWQPRCQVQGLVVLGSERGFCGRYNALLASALQAAVAANPQHAIIAVGGKFRAALELKTEVIGAAGASVAEEVPEVLLRIADAIEALQQLAGSCALSVIYHDPIAHQVVTRALFPVLPTAKTQTADNFAPRLNVEPQAMFSALLEERLYAALLAACYDALSEENRQRVAHLEGAVEHLDRRRTNLQLRRNYLRQEEITEEIEGILLSAEAAGGPKDVRVVAGLSGRKQTSPDIWNLVGAIGLEPTTPTMSRWCSNQLSYAPVGRKQ